MIRVDSQTQDALTEEARWLTAPADFARWRFGTWVTVRSWRHGSQMWTGCPAWFLPWNRPRRRRYRR